LVLEGIRKEEKHYTDNALADSLEKTDPSFVGLMFLLVFGTT
jgi:hypothetical protein